MSTPPQRIQGSKSVPDLERQTNIALERINGQLGTGGGTSSAALAALAARIAVLENLSGGFADIGGTGAGSPGPNPSDGTVATDGVTISGDGVNFPISLIEPVKAAVRVPLSTPDVIVSTDQFILAAASAGADQVEDLPAAVGPDANGRSRWLVIYKTDANAHNVVITPNGTDTINGVNATVSLVGVAAQYSSVRLLDAAAGAWLIW